MQVVCESCQTSNRAAAQYCLGCGGKLPAFYAVAGRATAPATLSPAPASTATPLRRAPPTPAPGSSSGSRKAVVAALVGLVLGMACVALWYIGYAAATGPRTPPAVPAMSSAATTEPTSAASAAEQQRTAATLAAASAALELLQRPPRELTPPTSAATDASPQARQTTASAARPVVGNPIAQCAELNFFSRAICVNNVCAQTAFANHPQCSDARRQRQRDEARRNLSN